MITVTNNDVKSINAALIANNEALKKEVSQTLEIENVKHADEADHATTADHADEADHAITADQLGPNEFTPTIVRDPTYTSGLTELFGVRSGNVCQIHFDFRLSNLPATTNCKIGTYTPKNSIPYSEVTLDYGLFLDGYFRVWFDSNGNIWAHSFKAINSQECRGCVTYICE